MDDERVVAAFETGERPGDAFSHTERGARAWKMSSAGSRHTLAQ